MTAQALAPVVLFAYRRPVHTERTLRALQRNALASESVLHVFCDGPQEASSEDDYRNIGEVRRLVRSKMWCGEVIIHESEVNRGLAGSVVAGVDAVLKSADRIIVLEDDLVTAPVFLRYMNAALTFFSDDLRVASINAWTYPVRRLPPYYLAPAAFSWGWATWRRAWCLYEPDANVLLSRATASYPRPEGLDGERMGLLTAAAEGKVDSWAIRWHAATVLAGKVGLFPGRSFVTNIGFDGSGTNCERAPDRKLPPLRHDFEASDLDHVYPSESSRAAAKIGRYKASFLGTRARRIALRILSHAS